MRSVLSRPCRLSLRRTTSSSPPPPLVVFEHHHRDGEGPPTATLTLNGPPVNSLNLEMLSALGNAIVEAEESGSCRGFVLASSHPTIFSAGLDIAELHNPDEGRLRDFWCALQDVFLALYGSRCATVAAIDGHAPAGGCLLAAACDERIMASGGRFGIGLNESKLGIVAPSWFADALQPLVGQRRLERMLQLGSLLSPAEALEAGLVDELAEHGGGNPIRGAARGVEGGEEEGQGQGKSRSGGDAPPRSPVLTRAHERLQQYVTVDPQARQMAKLLLRSDAIERLREKKQEDADAFVAFCLSPRYQANISEYLKGLKNHNNNKQEGERVRGDTSD